MADPHLQHGDPIQRNGAEERARFWQAEYTSLLESLPDAVYIQDLEGNLISVNSAGERLSGFSRTALRGMNLRRLFSADSYPSVLALANQAISGAQPLSGYAQMITANGSTA